MMFFFKSPKIASFITFYEIIEYFLFQTTFIRVRRTSKFQTKVKLNKNEVFSTFEYNYDANLITKKKKLQQSKILKVQIILSFKQRIYIVHLRSLIILLNKRKNSGFC